MRESELAQRSWTEFRLAAMLLALMIPVVAALTPTPVSPLPTQVGSESQPGMAAGVTSGGSTGSPAIVHPQVAEPPTGPRSRLAPIPSVEQDPDVDPLLPGAFVAGRLPATLWQVLARGV